MRNNLVSRQEEDQHTDWRLDIGSFHINAPGVTACWMEFSGGATACLKGHQLCKRSLASPAMKEYPWMRTGFALVVPRVRGSPEDGRDS